MTDETILRIGVSACLLGQRVRFDGGHKRDPFLADALGRFVEWVQVCPEEGAGFGTPREAMRLVQTEAGIRLLTVRSRRDLTGELSAHSASQVSQLAALDLDGFVLKKDSPSCGLTRVKVYTEHGGPTRSGRGLFAQALCARLPLLPVEEEGRLCDPPIRENFVERLFAYRRLRGLLTTPQLRTRDVVQFHARHKLLLLAHAPAAYAELGRLVAGVRDGALAAVAAGYGEIFMRALTTIATRGRHSNVLRHMAGYLRELLVDDARRDVATAIDDYQGGLIPLVVPVRLIAHYAKLHEVRYLCEQFYLDPHPKELMLRNHV